MMKCVHVYQQFYMYVSSSALLCKYVWMYEQTLCH